MSELALVGKLCMPEQILPSVDDGARLEIINKPSMLVLSHFKGHPMGGYGGALKQLSIGCASAAGKVNIHSAGKYTLAEDPGKEHFLERVTSRNGEHTIDAACEMGIGVVEYELIDC